ncbi:hypothetical protein ACWJJH_03660 [Endozoicomonadaceae bacterium StTr2]
MLHETILRVRDENALGNISHELQLRFDRVEVTARDIITERVLQEVVAYNNRAQQKQHASHTLVAPRAEETLLNGTGKKYQERPQVNAERQIEIAVEAFHSNGFFMLVDNEQIEDIDQQVIITPETVVSFIKLTPLVGG